MSFNAASSIVRATLTIMLALFMLFACVPAYAGADSHKITQEDMIYFIMTDRFYDGDTSNDANTSKKDLKAYHGGDFKGIEEKLDYIRGLGFTTIWISPVVKNEAFGYHGYWAYDFYKTEDHFGTVAQLKELVEKAHSKGIKVIVDLVVNHTGAMNPMASDPAYKDWFHQAGNIIDYNDQAQVENGRLAGLPDFNTENPQVRKYLIDMALWWIGQAGFDGYRLDTVKHVPKAFWAEFTKAIKKAYPDFYFIGEVFSGDVKYVAGYQATGIDGITDFPMYYAINDVFGGMKPASRLTETIGQNGAYSDPYLMGTFIDNHDVPRFVNQLTKYRDEKLEQALAFMMTYTGIPVMYYGTEIGMRGGSDPDNRRDMDWNAASPVTGYVRQLAAIRAGNRALSHGYIKVLGSGSDFLYYERKYKDNTILVVFNITNNPKVRKITLPADGPRGAAAVTDLLSGSKYAVRDNGVELGMSPRQAMIISYVRKGFLEAYGWLLAAAAVLAIIAAGAGLALTRGKRRRSKKV